MFIDLIIREGKAVGSVYPSVRPSVCYVPFVYTLSFEPTDLSAFKFFLPRDRDAVLARYLSSSYVCLWGLCLSHAGIVYQNG